MNMDAKILVTEQAKAFRSNWHRREPDYRMVFGNVQCGRSGGEQSLWLKNDFHKYVTAAIDIVAYQKPATA